MMISKVYSAIPIGYEGCLIEVEGGTAKSLPSFNIVGMANKTVSEARERVRSAITSSDFIFPTKKVTVNLAPAEVLKTGSYLDLPIAVTVLTLAKQILPASTAGKLFVGELSLDGHLKPVRGIINIIEIAKQSGFTEVILPGANLSQASLISEIKLTGVNTLADVVLYLHGIQPSCPVETPSVQCVVKNTQTEAEQVRRAPLLDHVRGQALAKRALIIALAGRHNLLLSGPPGSGKTLLAETAVSLLPPLTPAESIEVTKLHSLAQTHETIFTHRPFRAPHHTASTVAIVGGGIDLSPGEISLAHHGILFLDELPEFPRSVIESLRQPLESHIISIARAKKRSVYPADFTLIATMNPCPCGHLNDPSHPCTCTATQISQYHAKISGPILDRIDLSVNVERAKTTDLVSPRSVSTQNHDSEHRAAQSAIQRSLERQAHRYPTSSLRNGLLSPVDIETYLHLSAAAQQILRQAADTFQLSARSYFKIIKVARTIADLSDDEHAEIQAEHISEALSFRQIAK